MKLREKKFICDICGISLAAAILPCAFLLFMDVPQYMRMSFLIFLFAAGLMGVCAVRRRLEKKGGVHIRAAGAAVFALLALLSAASRLGLL